MWVHILRLRYNFFFFFLARNSSEYSLCCEEKKKVIVFPATNHKSYLLVSNTAFKNKNFFLIDMVGFCLVFKARRKRRTHVIWNGQKQFTSWNHMTSGEPRQKHHLYFHRKSVTYFWGLWKSSSFFSFLLALLSHNFAWGLSFNIHLFYQSSFLCKESAFLKRNLGASWMSTTMLIFCPLFPSKETSDIGWST